MDPLIIPKTDDTPAVHLDKTAGKFEFAAKSLPENVAKFYAPVIEWLKNYAEAPVDNATFEFKLTYFNTASSKVLLDILMLLEEINESGKKQQVAWYYKENDEDAKESGEEYSEIVSIDFKFIPY
jgi:hypothetical protein